MATNSSFSHFEIYCRIAFWKHRNQTKCCFSLLFTQDVFCFVFSSVVFPTNTFSSTNVLLFLCLLLFLHSIVSSRNWFFTILHVGFKLRSLQDTHRDEMKERHTHRNETKPHFLLVNYSQIKSNRVDNVCSSTFYRHVMLLSCVLVREFVYMACYCHYKLDSLSLLCYFNHNIRERDRERERNE